MKKLFMIALVAIIGSVATKAQSPATTEFRKEVETLMTKTASVRTLTEMLVTSMSVSLGDKMPADKLNEMCSDLAVELYPDIIEASVDAYSEIFTLQEMKEINQFYSTPLGQKMADNLSNINQITTTAMASPAVQQKMMPIIMSYMQYVK